MEEIKATAYYNMARRYSKETTWNTKATGRGQWKTLMEGYILQWINKAEVKGKQESNRQKAIEGIDGGLHPALDKQRLGER